MAGARSFKHAVRGSVVADPVDDANHRVEAVLNIVVHAPNVAVLCGVGVVDGFLEAVGPDIVGPAAGVEHGAAGLVESWWPG